MKLDMKVIIGGGLVMYVAQFIVGMVSGMVLHEGVLDPLYKATTEFWRPELNQDPPDMAALMPRWITVGVFVSLVYAAIYDNIRSALDGSDIIKGLKYGVLMALFYTLFNLAFSGVFNLPDAIWMWWTLEGFVIYPVGGVALGWFAGKFGSN